MKSYILAQLLAANGLTDILVGVHVLIDIIMRAEKIACAGVISGSIHGLNECCYNGLSVLHDNAH